MSWKKSSDLEMGWTHFLPSSPRAKTTGLADYPKHTNPSHNISQARDFAAPARDRPSLLEEKQ